MPAPVETLREVPLFARLPQETVERVAEAATEVEFPAQHVLIEPNEPGSGMYVLCEGRVSVHSRGGDRELGPGCVLGELALLRSDGRRSARVQALTPVRCLSLSRSDFVSVVESDPRLALALLEELANRIAED